MEPKFKVGEVVRHKTESGHKFVILKVLKRWFGGPQKYLVCWYTSGNEEFHQAVAHEVEFHDKVRTE